MTLLDKFKAATLVSLSVFLLAGAYLAWVTAQTQKQIAAQASVVLSHVNNTLTNVDATTAEVDLAVTNVGASFTSAAADVQQMRLALVPIADQLDQTLAFVNQKCIPVEGQVLTLADSKNCGTLADVSRTLQTMRGAIGTVEVAGENFDKHEALFYQQETQLFYTANTAFAHFDTLVSSPDLAAAMVNGKTLLGNLDVGTALVDKKMDEVFYPPPCVHTWCKIKDTWNVLRAGSQLLMPAYYGWELFTGGH
jgi:hypothetical protein